MNRIQTREEFYKQSDEGSFYNKESGADIYASFISIRKGAWWKYVFIFFLLFVLILSSCESQKQESVVYQKPEQLQDGFITGSLEDVNLNGALLKEAVGEINDGKYGEIHSFMIYKDGLLVFEEYFPGHNYQWDAPGFKGAWVNWDASRRHNIHSAGKSVTSACVGIAVEEGFINSVEQSIFDYLPDYQYLNTDGKDQITIEHLLTMSSGLAWDEWGASYASDDNDVIALWQYCDDPIACVLEKPLVSEPGTTFTYSGGNMILLGEIVRNASGMDIEAFSWEYLFSPTGVEKPAWRWIEDTNVIYAGGDQILTPREMLKFGVTYLNDGMWNDNQIISPEWIEHSATSYSGAGNHWFNHAINPIPPGDNTWGPRGYSYGWWVHEFSYHGKAIPAYWAFGWGGQSIRIFPDQNTVVVFTGANYNTVDSTIEILKDYVIPAFDLK